VEYNCLGRSGLKVSRICLGTNNFGGQVDEENSIKMIKNAIDLGINMIDTGNTYPIHPNISSNLGRKSEEIIGNAVQGYRDEIIITTKVGLGQGPNCGGLSRKHILWQIKQSLERLKTDYIDIYCLHRFDQNTPLKETLRTMNDLVRAGKVNYVACSNFSAWQIAKTREISEALGLEEFIAVEAQYNLLQREVERDVLPYCQEEGLGVLAFSPLIGGFLTGKYTKDVPPPFGSRCYHDPRYWKHVKEEENFAVLEQIKIVAEEAGLALPQMAIAWVLKNPVMTALIVGASKPEHIEGDCRVTATDISDETYNRLNEITRPILTANRSNILGGALKPFS